MATPRKTRRPVVTTRTVSNYPRPTVLELQSMLVGIGLIPDAIIEDDDHLYVDSLRSTGPITQAVAVWRAGTVYLTTSA